MSMISRQVAELREWSEHENLVEENRMMANLLFNAADTIEMLSEKARGSKHGEWINVGTYEECKDCGEVKRFPHWKFCPNCGAKMREE